MCMLELIKINLAPDFLQQAGSTRWHRFFGLEHPVHDFGHVTGSGYGIGHGYGRASLHSGPATAGLVLILHVKVP